MKKLLAFVATVFCIGIGTSAFATEPAPAADAAPTNIKFTKTYEGADVFPAEELKFTSVADAANPDKGAANLTIADVTASAMSFDVEATLPTYTEVGVYKYSITERTGSTQGVTYGTDKIDVSVLVGYNNAGEKVVLEAGITKPEDGDKQDTITNTYDVGTLQVTKKVTGNLGDKTKEFKVTVTFAPESDKAIASAITYSGGKYTQDVTAENNQAEIEVKDGDTVTFANVPVGTTFTVAEDAGYAEEGVNDPEKGYTVTYKVNNAAADAGTGAISKTASTVEITNNKETEIDTGITLDSLPYIGLLALVLAVALVWVLRRRAAAE